MAMDRRKAGKSSVDNLRAAGWDLGVAAILVIVSASALLLVVLTP
ncbi:MAG TPA: hypothetical protein VLU92_07545 [Candidatus Dormibacteraeota bacterium]|nr:hypothetical protein [Candidatus Dormibacteraeota bacterium]